jgi:MFS family permease
MEHNAVISIITGVAIGAISFYLRIKSRLSQRNFGIDSWYFLLYSEELRKDKRIPVKIPYFLLDIEEQWYPPGLPILLAIIPPKFLRSFHWLISAFIDTLSNLLIYGLTYIITRDFRISLGAGVFYATSPLLITQNSNLNGRAMGAFLLNVYLAGAYFYLYMSGMWLILMLISALMILFTHKFTTQFLFVISIYLAVAYLNIIFLAIPVSAVIFAIFVSKGFYYKILKGHAQILWFWSRNLVYSGAHQIYDSSVYKDEYKAKEKRGCGGVAAAKHYFILIKVQFLFMFVITCLYVYFGRQGLGSAGIFFFHCFLCNFLCVSIVSYFKPLKFLGEGWRYFTFGAFSTSFIFSYLFLAKAGIFGVVLYAVFILTNIFIIRRISKEQKKNILARVSDDLKLVLNKLKGLPRDNVLSLPFSNSEHIAYFCRKKTLWGAHGYGYDRLEDFWPVLRKPIEYFIEKYNLAYCLLNKEYVNIGDLCLRIPYEIICEQNEFLLLEFISKRGGK